MRAVEREAAGREQEQSGNERESVLGKGDGEVQ